MGICCALWTCFSCFSPLQQIQLCKDWSHHQLCLWLCLEAGLYSVSWKIWAGKLCGAVWAEGLNNSSENLGWSVLVHSNVGVVWGCLNLPWVGDGNTATSGKLNIAKNKDTGSSMSVANPKQLWVYDRKQAEGNGRAAPDFCRMESWREGCSSVGAGDQGTPYSWGCKEVLRRWRGSSCSGSLVFSLQHEGRVWATGLNISEACHKLLEK